MKYDHLSLVLIHQLGYLLIGLVLGYLARTIKHPRLLQYFRTVYPFEQLLNDFDVEDFQLGHARLLRLFRLEVGRRAAPVQPWGQLAPLVLSLDLVLPDALVRSLLWQIGESRLLQRLGKFFLLCER